MRCFARLKARFSKRAAPEKPLAAQLDNPYTPIFGQPRLFEELACHRQEPVQSKAQDFDKKQG